MSIPWKYLLHLILHASTYFQGTEEEWYYVFEEISYGMEPDVIFIKIHRTGVDTLLNVQDRWIRFHELNVYYMRPPNYSWQLKEIIYYMFENGMLYKLRDINAGVLDTNKLEMEVIHSKEILQNHLGYKLNKLVTIGSKTLIDIHSSRKYLEY
jgi:hypothetical protein